MIAKYRMTVHDNPIGRNHHFMHMQREMLEKTYESLKRQLSLQAAEEDLGLYVEKLKAIAQFEGRAISLFDIQSNTFLLQADEHFRILGYEEKPLDIESYHALIHPDDIPYILDAEIQMFRFLQDKPNKQDYKLIYDYRVKHKEGHYLRFLHQMAVFACNKEGNPSLMLIIGDLLQRWDEDQCPKRLLIDTRNGKVCLFNEESEIAFTLVSNREREILSLISQGLASIEIANLLCISIHTVNNHRQNILRKTRTRHIAQAIYYLSRIGLLN